MGVLVVTSESGTGRAGQIEVMDALLPKDMMLDANVTPYRGVLLVRTRLDALKAHSLILSSLPKHISRVIPIETECEPNVDSITNAALAAMRGKGGGPFMVRCKARGSELSETHVERVVGAYVKDRTGLGVDLKDPDFVIHVEIVGNFAGVSVLPAGFPISMKSVREDIVSSMRYILRERS